MKKPTNKGVQGGRVEIEPRKLETLSENDVLLPIGSVTGIGTTSKFKGKVGDVIVFSDWLIEKPKVEDKTYYFVPDEAILKIV